MTLLGGGRVGYLRAAAPAAPAAFEDEEPICECGVIRFVGLLRCKASITSNRKRTLWDFLPADPGHVHEVIHQSDQRCSNS